MKSRKSKNQSKRNRRRRRKSHAKSIAHFVRGLVMEGMGVAVLLMIYFTIQSTSANGVLEKGEQRAVGVDYLEAGHSEARIQEPNLSSSFEDVDYTNPSLATTNPFFVRR